MSVYPTETYLFFYKLYFDAYGNFLKIISLRGEEDVPHILVKSTN